MREQAIEAMARAMDDANMDQRGSPNQIRARAALDALLALLRAHEWDLSNTMVTKWFGEEVPPNRGYHYRMGIALKAALATLSDKDDH